MNFLKSVLVSGFLCLGFLPARAWDPNKPFIYEMRIAMEADNWFNFYSTATVLSKSNNTEAFRVVANSTTTPTYQLVVTTQGNVGISTGNPTQRFEVTGTIYSNSGGFKFPDGTTQTTAASASSTLPSGAQEGDLLYYSNGTWTRLPMGSDGQSLKAINCTKLLLHLDNNLTDSATGKTVTNHSVTFDNSSNNYKFGYSGKFGSSSYLSLDDSDDWNFGSGAWTIDFWVKIPSLPDAVYALFGQYVDTDNLAWAMIHSAGGGRIYFNIVAAGSLVVDFHTTGTVPIGQWVHLAFIHSGTNYYISINGTVESFSSAGNWGDYASVFYVGRMTDRAPTTYYFNGWLDELRISKGIARWTANFTPPSSPYTVTPSLLWSN